MVNDVVVLSIYTNGINKEEEERIIRNSKLPTDCKFKITEKDNFDHSCVGIKYDHKNDNECSATKCTLEQIKHKKGWVI